jgi:UDP-glucose 4-epimerase
MKYLVTGGAGFIGSHLVDKLVEIGHEVVVVDNFLSGLMSQINSKAGLHACDIRTEEFLAVVQHYRPDGIFHFAAIARTPWCIDDPVLAAEVNAMGTMKVLEAGRRAGVKRFVLSSSNVVYAAYTPYRATKEMGEMWGRVYNDLYGQSVISLRYSNVYGTRQQETGPSPNVFASFRKSIREKGYAVVTGDGEQTRDFTHVSDIVEGNIAAMQSEYKGVLDLCTGTNWSMNQVVRDMFKAKIFYAPEREGDVKHIFQDAKPASNILGWKAKVYLPDGIKDCL